MGIGSRLIQFVGGLALGFLSYSAFSYGWSAITAPLGSISALHLFLGILAIFPVGVFLGFLALFYIVMGIFGD